MFSGSTGSGPISAVSASAVPKGCRQPAWPRSSRCSIRGGPCSRLLRSVRPLPGRPRYLNAASRLALNPRLALYEPAVASRPCVVVTEGVIDALSANAAGFRSAAVLGAALVGGTSERGDSVAARRLARLDSTLILAFDADDAGTRAATLLHSQLHKRGMRTALIHVPPDVNDLNGWMLRSRDWARSLASAVRTALVAVPKAHHLTR